MSCWSKEELENMLEDVVNELNLSDRSIYEHGPNGTPPADLVRLILKEKDQQIRMLKQGFTNIKGERMQRYAIEYDDLVECDVGDLVK